MPRFTKDIDITLRLDLSSLKNITEIASKLELTILADEDFVNKTRVLPAITEGIRVDFIFSTSIYERQAIKRAREAKIDEVEVKIASLEDLIIHKIIAGRPRDIEDVEGILLKNPDSESDLDSDLDRRYIVDWLKRFDLALNQNFTSTFERIEKDLTNLQSYKA